jgi:homoserine kinase
MISSHQRATLTMPQRISVRVPATCANLGCLFDCAALALSLYLDIYVTPRQDGAVTVSYRGVNPERIPTDETNLIARTISTTLQSWNKKRGFDLEIENQIPVGVGLGSSAAAIVGALAACHWLADTTLYDEELVSLAMRLEGHPDNVAAAWHGGFTVAVRQGERVLAYSAPVPETLQLVLVIPDYALPTEKAREVLPDQYSRADAIHNLQRAAALAGQLFSGKADFHPGFFDDRWHQPFRASLVPGLSETLKLQHPDLLGVCLSGAGPSILAFVRGDAAGIGELIRQTLAQQGIEAEARVLAADNRGAKGWSLPA